MSSMVELNSVILNKLICEKIWMDTWTDRQTDRQMDERLSEKVTSFQLRWAKKGCEKLLLFSFVKEGKRIKFSEYRVKRAWGSMRRHQCIYIFHVN